MITQILKDDYIDLLDFLMYFYLCHRFLIDVIKDFYPFLIFDGFYLGS
jgi:hypothetical protein